MEHTVNRIELCGTLCGLPIFSHENHERKFYRFELEVERLSGAKDVLPVVAAEDVLRSLDLFCGCTVELIGQIRSFNSRSDVGRKLIISVYAEYLAVSGRTAENDVRLIGTVCKPPVFRRTPLGRNICDVMLAVNRLYRRTDYIPCILWGRTAQQFYEMPVGTALSLCGRLQSRTYLKALPEGNEQRIAYEVSVTQAEEYKQSS